MPKIKDFSKPVKQEELEAAYAKGMPRMSELKDGVVYKGHCRNADEAMWLEEFKKFVYIRSKFGQVFLESINHPEQDDGYDLFIPTKEEVEESERDAYIFISLLPDFIKWLRERK